MEQSVSSMEHWSSHWGWLVSLSEIQRSWRELHGAVGELFGTVSNVFHQTFRRNEQTNFPNSHWAIERSGLAPWSSHWGWLVSLSEIQRSRRGLHGAVGELLVVRLRHVGVGHRAVQLCRAWRTDVVKRDDPHSRTLRLHEPGLLHQQQKKTEEIYITNLIGLDSHLIFLLAIVVLTNFTSAAAC